MTVPGARPAKAAVSARGGRAPLDLESPVAALRGAGPRLAGKLEKLGLHSVQDLLFHLPLRYQDRTRITPLGALQVGDEALVEGEVLLTEIKPGRRRALLSRISDGTGSLTLRFFHFNDSLKARLAPGLRVRCYGEARPGPMTLELVHPEFGVAVPEAAAHAAEACLTPIYPSTEGMHQRVLRSLAEQALDLCMASPVTAEILPARCLPHTDWPALVEALMYVHRPPPDASLELLAAGRHPAQRRLAFEELLAHHLSLRRLRARAARHRAPVLDGPGRLFAGLEANLPYRLTAAQQRVIAEIREDLKRAHPMQRLVQGDVGSGKTIVACAAVLAAVEAGYQAVLMAPTELLAEQHQRNFRAWLEPLGIEVGWISGRLGAKARRELLARLAGGGVQVAVGTHALFQDEVEFRELGLVVVDEQHRFGVHQRLALREKGRAGGRWPHQLIMTATPIPRTLAMVGYADLDCSVIDERPPGRKPVDTVVIPEARREEVVQRVQAACARGAQAYWVCTLIDESEALQCQAAADTAAALAGALPELRVGLVHGRLKGPEKEGIMAAFQAGELDLLVATTVIEVGVDVPNASLMIIENAERLGLAQLHQLRGRVGRGSRGSVCVLMYHPPLGQLGRERLAILRATDDGFEIARRDLELRGPGEVLGTRQSGLVALRVADLARDQDLIAHIESAAASLPRESAEGLIRRWLGPAQLYGEV